MYKIYLPTNKKSANIRGYWYNKDNKKSYKDFLTSIELPKISDKILKNYCKQYKQEAIFYEVISNRTGKLLSGVIWYNRTKKEVMKERRVYFVDTKRKLIDHIKKWKNLNTKNYTIEKKDKYYILFHWYNIKNNRIRKRNKLLKKLVIKIIDNLNDKINFNYEVRKTSIIKSKRHIAYFDPITNKVYFNPSLIKKSLLKFGIDDCYYKDRTKKINSYLIGNYKTCLRFTILHELGHSYFYKKYRGYKNFLKWWHTFSVCEKYADSFALRYINKI